MLYWIDIFECLGYADDVTLIAPSLHSFRQMIEICEFYAIEYDIIFNPDKSKVMCFNNGNYIDFSIQLFNHTIEVVDSYTHLGNYISTNIEDKNVQKLLRFYMRTNYMLADFNMLNCFKTAT